MQFFKREKNSVFNFPAPALLLKTSKGEAGTESIVTFYVEYIQIVLDRLTSGWCPLEECNHLISSFCDDSCRVHLKGNFSKTFVRVAGQQGRHENRRRN